MDTAYMKRAIELAKRGTGLTAPNPLVGAVIVKDGRVIGEGWHVKYGELHAERHALANCSESTEGADMYVTLEPCCHHGKQPPCTDAVIAAGIKRLFVGSYDPNPLVSGKSGEILKAAGIDVTYEVLRAECDKLNPFFFHYMKTNMPYVICKYAMTADGKIACRTGHSRWITGDGARADVQETRRAVSAIMVGIGTVLADNPSLLCHAANPVHPVRVVCDTHLSIPENSELIETAKDSPVIVMTSSDNADKINRLTAKGAEVCIVPERDGHTDIRAVLALLSEKKLTSVLVEGGGKLHASVLRENPADEVQVYIAPKIIGGDGISPVGTLGTETMQDAFEMSQPEVQLFGQDVKLTFKRKDG